jgi:hypothetical protein
MKIPLGRLLRFTVIAAVLVGFLLSNHTLPASAASTGYKLDAVNGWFQPDLVVCSGVPEILNTGSAAWVLLYSDNQSIVIATVGGDRAAMRRPTAPQLWHPAEAIQDGRPQPEIGARARKLVVGPHQRRSQRRPCGRIAHPCVSHAMSAQSLQVTGRP